MTSKEGFCSSCHPRSLTSQAYAYQFKFGTRSETADDSHQCARVISNSMSFSGRAKENSIQFLSCPHLVCKAHFFRSVCYIHVAGCSGSSLRAWVRKALFQIKLAP